MRNNYTHEDIEKIIYKLTKEFEQSCEHYYDALVDRKSNRALKELAKRNLRGSRLYDFQSDFSWILHDIKCGPICFIEENVEKAQNLINSINDIS